MSSATKPTSRAVLLVMCALLALTPVTAQAASPGNETEPARIVMVTWRGCEDACQGFQDHLRNVGLEAEVTILDAARDHDLLPGFVEEVKVLRPDLLVTWGTSVTLGLIGTIDDVGEGLVTDVPALFMIVADPLGARIIKAYDRSGRPLVTGVHNRVPEVIQMRVLADYLPFTRIGLIYNQDELNAVLKAAEIQKLASSQGFDVVERVLARDHTGDPLVSDIRRAVADIAAQDVQFLYVGSSSFLLQNADLFTSAALEFGLPVATAYEAMVRDSRGLIALASAYYNVGQLAGHQAEKILTGGQAPGDLEVLGLDRFSVLINIDSARELGLYPPMLLLRYAEIVGNE